MQLQTRSCKWHGCVHTILISMMIKVLFNYDRAANISVCRVFVVTLPNYDRATNTRPPRIRRAEIVNYDRATTFSAGS